MPTANAPATTPAPAPATTDPGVPLQIGSDGLGGGRDESVKVPAAVRAAAARAEKLAANLHTGDVGAPAPTPALTPALTPASTPAPQVTSEGNTSPDWEHLYKSDKGRFDEAQRARLALTKRISELENVLAVMNTQVSPEPTPSAPAQAERFISPEEVQEYGDEFLSVVGKKAKEELLPELAKVRQELDSVRGQLNGVGQHIALSAREQLFGSLDKDIPQWRNINTSKEFLDWLALPDAYSGAIRQNLLTAAFQRNDTSRVAAFFRGFISDEAVTTAAPAPQPVPRVNPPKLPLETLAAPGRAKTAATPDVPAEKPTITRAQIKQFYSDVHHGKYSEHDAEKKQIEAAIFAATAEGRVR